MPAELELPHRLRGRPRQGGYVVPFFVARLGDRYDFRAFNTAGFERAIQHRLCWICGQPLGVYGSFVTGPMAAINRVHAEPPSHRDCAIYAARIWPHLADQGATRRPSGLPAERQMAGLPSPGHPGAVRVWSTRSHKQRRIGDGLLFDLGPPSEILWFARGSLADRRTARAALEQSLGRLRQLAEVDGPQAMAELDTL